MYKFNDLTGKIFNGVKVNFRTGSSKRWLTTWNCTCTCGKEFIVVGSDLANGHTRSCGCLAKAIHTKHGDCNTAIYRCWKHIKDRCLNANTKNYKDYGGRGITISEKWLDYNIFKKDVKTGYKPGLSLDRIDNNGNYEPGNVRWATAKQQCRNTRKNKFIDTPFGFITMAEACEKSGLNRQTLRNRIERGWPKEKWFISVKS